MRGHNRQRCRICLRLAYGAAIMRMQGVGSKPKAVWWSDLRDNAGYLPKHAFKARCRLALASVYHSRL